MRNIIFLGKDVIGNPIIDLRTGRQIGRVQDLYLDNELRSVTGIYAGSEGLLNPTPKWIAATDISVISADAVLTNNDTVMEEPIRDDIAWLRRDDLQGRSIDTKGGTKIGRVGDVIVDSGANVIGFSLDRVYVHGPIAERRALRRAAVLDTGHEDGSMTINLEEAEQHDLRIVSKAFFSEEVMLIDEDSDLISESSHEDFAEEEEDASRQEAPSPIGSEATMETEMNEEDRTPRPTP